MHILVQDDSSHWYVIPADKEDEWFEYRDAVTDYWDSNPVDPDDLYEEPICPDWAVAVGGAPSLVKFGNYEIE